MKKKVLIVFLICCMLLGVASPAFASEVDIYSFSTPGLSSDGSVLNHYPNIFVSKSNPGIGMMVQLIDRSSPINDPLHFPVYYDNTQENVLSIYVDVTGHVDSYSSYGSLFYYDVYMSNGKVRGASVSADTDVVTVGNSSFFRLNFNTSNEYVSLVSTLDSSELRSVLGSCYVWDNGPTEIILGELPPQMMDLGVTMVEVPVGQQAVGMMKTLLPYGISCLALLISLLLLLKVLRRFLG